MDIAALNQVNVNITVDIAEGSYPIGELLDLPAGHELMLRATENILRVNDQLYAVVELIDMDGEWHARILRLVGQDPASERPEARSVGRASLREQMGKILGRAS